MGIDIYSQQRWRFYHVRVYSFIHIVKENVLTWRIFVSLWRRCGVKPGRDEGAAV